ncbi:integral membrane [Pyrenophora seminiperda CCB06]|uniref:Integral membrane n=1 Tax=Pyrenophora seminiperda CCB06 TaxID=1302712 RepID=A0A3M7MB37_9PLEO|nr:integral membrane [Pyrenophora seminiperda CCB06]
MNGMAPGLSPNRPIRARKSVRTYNLKTLSRTSSITRRTSQAIEPKSARLSESPKTTESKEENPYPSYSEESSELTSPMMSPNLRALETSLSEGGITIPPTQSSVSPKGADLYDCFNSIPHPKGHFYSAKELFARGVWIGYLSPERHKESFYGLPSFNSLKANFTNFSPPYPPIIHGSVRENRNAVCRGCARSTSGVIALSEIHFVRASKLVIMPLDADDDFGAFAIMVPQKVDRSLHGLQSYRPYELTDGGKGESFVNNYMLLTIRNSDSESGTLETVLKVLAAQEHANTVRKDVDPSHFLLDNQPISSSPSTITDANFARASETILNDGRSVVPKQQKTGITIGDHHDTMEDMRNDGEGIYIQGNFEITPGLSEPAMELTKPPGLDATIPRDNSPAKQQKWMTPEPLGSEPQATKAPSLVQSIPRDDSFAQRQNTRTPEPPLSSLHAAKTSSPMQSIPRDNNHLLSEKKMPKLSERSDKVIKEPSPIQSMTFGLTDEQAECIHLTWTGKDTEMEYEFGYTLGECKTFGGFLALLEEGTQAFPTFADMLARTKTWQMTLRLGDGTNKAFVARRGAETAFNRLQTTLARAPIWMSTPYPTVDVEVRSLG